MIPCSACSHLFAYLVIRLTEKQEKSASKAILILFLHNDKGFHFSNCLTLYIKNAQECLTIISKHEKAREAREAKPRELFI